MEIATLNGLKAPWVDETGFAVQFATNGSQYQFSVADGSNLYNGQRIWLSSQTISRELRRIQTVQQVGVNWNITVDGAGDMDKFLIADNASLQAFLPGTVNSQQQIFIPSDKQPDGTDYLTTDIPGIDYSDPLIQSCGIDLMVTGPTNDLVVSSNGDGKWAVGLKNQIQKIKVALSTRKKSVLDHPNFGIELQPGDTDADVSAEQIMSDLKQMFKDDPGFEGVSAVQVIKDGHSVKIRLSVGIKGAGKYIPIEVGIQ
jgi:hypothetical protein